MCTLNIEYVLVWFLLTFSTKLSFFNPLFSAYACKKIYLILFILSAASKIIMRWKKVVCSTLTEVTTNLHIDWPFGMRQRFLYPSIWWNINAIMVNIFFTCCLSRKRTKIIPRSPEMGMERVISIIYHNQHAIRRWECKNIDFVLVFDSDFRQFTMRCWGDSHRVDKYFDLPYVDRRNLFLIYRVAQHIFRS